jgi:hypothetical protein
VSDQAPQWARHAIYLIKGGWTDWRWFDRYYDRHPKPAVWIMDHVGDWIELHVADKVAAWLCRRYGHLPEVDHCGLPEHDFCTGCNALTPGMAYRDPGLPAKWEAHMGKPYPWEFDGARWVRKESP